MNTHLVNKVTVKSATVNRLWNSCLATYRIQQTAVQLLQETKLCLCLKFLLISRKVSVTELLDLNQHGLGGTMQTVVVWMLWLPKLPAGIQAPSTTVWEMGPLGGHEWDERPHSRVGGSSGVPEHGRHCLRGTGPPQPICWLLGFRLSRLQNYERELCCF